MTRDLGPLTSVVDLAGELIRRPSRAGLDGHAPVLAVLEDWLATRGLPCRRLHDGTRRPVALLVEIAGGRPGRWWTLDACVDTAPFGDERAWSVPPATGDVVDGRLRGRGAADSKLVGALFCHFAAELHGRAGEQRGGLAVLLDAAEHTASGAPGRISPTRTRSARPG
jgi:succinyl-diaminopimelate desuccinylase